MPDSDKKAKKAEEAEEARRAEAMRQEVCPIVAAKEARKEKELAKKRQKQVADFQRQAEERKKKSAEETEWNGQVKTGEGKASATTDSIGPLPFELEESAFAYYGNEGMREIRLSQIF
jgi:hypothetical protein